jgi:hypothetical protein
MRGLKINISSCTANVTHIPCKARDGNNGKSPNKKIEKGRQNMLQYPAAAIFKLTTMCPVVVELTPSNL